MAGLEEVEHTRELIPIGPEDSRRAPLEMTCRRAQRIRGAQMLAPSKKPAAPSARRQAGKRCDPPALAADTEPLDTCLIA